MKTLEKCSHLFLLGCLASFPLGPQKAFAQSSESESGSVQPAQAETIVVRGRRRFEDRFNSTASTVNVSRQDIEAMGANTIGDILRQLPGLQVTSNGNGGLEIRMRGMGPEGTRILVDGAAVSSSRQNVQLSIDELPADMIERIEIVRSPTAEYEGAAGGTINVVMRGAQAKRETHLWLSNQHVWGRNALAGFVSQTGPLSAPKEANSKQAQNGGSTEREGSVNAASGTPEPESTRWSYLVSLTGGPRNLGNEVRRDTSIRSSTPSTESLSELARSRYSSWTLSPRLTGRISSTDTVVIRSILTGFEHPGFISSKGAGTNGADPTAAQTYSSHLNERRSAQIALDWTRRFSEMKLDSTFSYEQSTGNYRFDRESTTSLAGQTSIRGASFNDDRREQVALIKSKLTGASGESIWSFGGEANQHRFSVASTSVAEAVATELGLNSTIRSAALWAQNEFPIDALKSTVNVGLRGQSYLIDVDSADGPLENRQFYWQPTVNLRARLAQDTQLRWNLARVTRTPKVWELISRSIPNAAANSPNSPDFQGNANLKSESSVSMDIGIDQRLSGQGQAGINLFVRDQTDVIGRRLSSPGGRWLVRPENIGDALVWGVESDIRGDLQWAGLDPQWTISANASVLQSRMRSGETVGARIPGQARYLANLTVARPMQKSGGWFGGGTLARVGSSDLTQPAGPGVSISGHDRSFSSLDLYVGRVDPRWGYWRLNVYNITDYNKNTTRVIVDSNGVVYTDQSQRRLTPRVFLTLGTRF